MVFFQTPKYTPMPCWRKEQESVRKNGISWKRFLKISGTLPGVTRIAKEILSEA
jgi:hypothetical protein